MKIKTKRVSIDYALQTTPLEKEKLKKPSLLWNTLIRILSTPTMWKTKFTYTKKRMENAKGPCLILMNHSCFVDMKVLSKIFYPKRYFIVGTTDSLVGKKWLMKKIGILMIALALGFLDAPIQFVSNCFMELIQHIVF